jgi:hypothetical protein
VENFHGDFERSSIDRTNPVTIKRRFWTGVGEYLPWAFVEAAHFAARFCPEAKRFYAKKFAKTNGAVATKALAHKLARACYHMLKTGQPFEVKRCFAG